MQMLRALMSFLKRINSCSLGRGLFTYYALYKLWTADLKFSDGVEYVNLILQFDPIQDKTERAIQTATLGTIPKN